MVEGKENAFSILTGLSLGMPLSNPGRLHLKSTVRRSKDAFTSKSLSISLTPPLASTLQKAHTLYMAFSTKVSGGVRTPL